MRWFAILAAASMLAFGCGGMVEDAEWETAEQALGRACLSDDDCRGNRYCNMDLDECQSGCRPNQVCIALCYGECRPLSDLESDDDAAGDPCGDVVCGAGLVCCNESCGICTEPDGRCTTQYCTDDDDLL